MRSIRTIMKKRSALIFGGVIIVYPSLEGCKSLSNDITMLLSLLALFIVGFRLALICLTFNSPVVTEKKCSSW